MKTILKLTLCLLFVSASQVSVAQDNLPVLSYGSNGFSYNYQSNGRSVSYETFLAQLNQQSDLSAQLFKSGRSLAISGTVVGSVGAFCFGWDLGTRLAGGDGNLGMLIGGGSVMVIGLIMGNSGENKMKKAIELYRDRQQEVSLSFGTTSSGFGLCLNF